jgi:hypothetical protein
MGAHDHRGDCPSDRMGDHLGGGEAHWELNFIQATQEKNTENRLIMRDRTLTKHSMQNWQAHLTHS